MAKQNMNFAITKERENIIKEISDDDYFCFSVGKGWHGIVKKFLRICEKNGLIVEQIKEKFGHLRLYYTYDENSETDEGTKNNVEGEIGTLEDYSQFICENCGAEDLAANVKMRIIRNYWYKTYCDTCSFAVILYL